VLQIVTPFITTNTSESSVHTTGVASVYIWNITFHSNCRVVTALLVRCDEWPAALSPEVEVCWNWHHWSCRVTSIFWQLQNL